MTVIEDMTLNEYLLRMEAYQLERVDIERDIALQAWMTQVAKSTEGEGDNIRPKYQHFSDLYDYNANRNAILSAYGDADPEKIKEEKAKSDPMLIAAKRMKEWQKMKENERKTKTVNKRS